MKILLTLCLIFACYNTSQQASFSDAEKTELKFETKLLTTQDSISLVLSRYISDSVIVRLIVAQAKHESGNFKNSLSKNHNNLFGRHWHKSDTLSLGSGAYAEGHNNFARYPSIEYATISQYNYLVKKKYSFKWKTAYEYAAELKSKNYYTAPLNQYAVCLEKHYNNLLEKK